MSAKQWYLKLRARRELEDADRKRAAGDVEAALLRLARAAVFADAEPGLKRVAHRQAADLLAGLDRYDESALQLRSLIALDGGDVALWRELAGRLEQAGQADQAIVAWDALLQLQPQAPRVHERLASLLIANGRPADAVPHVRHLAEAAQNDLDAWRRLAVLLEETGDRRGAADIWSNLAARDEAARERAIELFTELGRAKQANQLLRDLARAREQAGDLDGALAAWARLPERDEGAREELARLLDAQGRTEEATPHIRALAELAPTKAKRWRRLAERLEDAGHAAEAMPLWMRVLELSPDDALSIRRARELLPQLPVDPEVVSHYRVLVQLSPNDTGVLRGLAKTLKATGDPAGAIEAWLGVVRLSPADLEAHEQLGNLLLGLKRTAEALPHLRLHAEALPENPKLWRRLATALQLLGEAEPAVDAWGRLLTLAPADLQAREQTVIVLRALGRKLELAQHLPILARVSAKGPELRRELARLLDELNGEAEPRTQAWRAVLGDAPDDLEAHGRLATLIWEAGARIEAIPHLRIVTRAQPRQLKPWTRLAISQEETGDVEGEIEALVQVAALDRADRQARWRLAKLLWESGRTRAAIPYLRVVASGDAKSLKELRRLGRSLGEGGDLEAEEAASLDETGEVHEQIAVWKLVAATVPGDGEANARLAELFWEMNRKAEAAPYQRLVARAAPRQAKSWRRLATCLEQTGEIDEAILAWRHLAALEGEHGPARARAEALALRRDEVVPDVTETASAGDSGDDL